MTTRDSAALLAARTRVEDLREAQRRNVPDGDVALLETHISWVLLSGAFAYKIKKPLNLGFLDFRRLERRRYYCEEELRLNRRFAPSLYLEVVPITRNGGRAQFGGGGDALDYAVRMRRFDQGRLLDRQLDGGRLTADDLRALAQRVAQWHETAERTPAAQRRDTLARTVELIVENFAPIERALGAEPSTSRRRAVDRTGVAAAMDGALDGVSVSGRLRTWIDGQLETLHDTLTERFDQGFFRTCHGDLHLRNLVRLDDGITAFDCIEFDAQLRDIDVVADYAFLLMDLMARGETALAATFFNRYLEVSADYGGVRVYNLYFVYRCLVRAKIAVFRAAGRRTSEEQAADFDEARRYLDIALGQCAPRTPLLVALHGLTGAGKSWVSGALVPALPALRLRSDLERKRMAGLAPTASSRSGVGTDLYDDATSDRVYQRLFELAEPMLRAGHDVILDAAFLDRKRRHDARALAARSGARFALLEVTASEAELRKRLARRGAQGDDVSEGNARVLEHQLATRDVLDDSEKTARLVCRSDDLDLNALVDRLRATVRHPATQRSEG